MTTTNKTAVQEELLGATEVKAYDNNNSGALFKNDKRTKDTHPNSRGKVMVDGKHYWISGWSRKSSNDQPFISLAFTEMTVEEIEKYVK